jgi:hypothetical protein
MGLLCKSERAVGRERQEDPNRDGVQAKTRGVHRQTGKRMHRKTQKMGSGKANAQEDSKNGKRKWEVERSGERQVLSSRSESAGQRGASKWK